MQVGYSFLIGGMCAIALLKTGCIWIPALIHGIYDAGGFLIESAGQGEIWTTPAIILTAAVSLPVFGYAVWVMLRITEEEVKTCI